MTNDPSSPASSADKELETRTIERRDVVRGVMGTVGTALGEQLLSGCNNASAQGNAEVTAAAAQALSGTNVIWFDTLYGTVPGQCLMTTPGASPNQAAIVQGYWSAGDGGGGLFFWTTDTTSQEDGGMVIVAPPSGPRTGCWKRVVGDYLDVAWFGAMASTTSPAKPNIQCFQHALNALLALGSPTHRAGKHVVNGVFYLENTLDLTNTVIIEGSGALDYGGPGMPSWAGSTANCPGTMLVFPQVSTVYGSTRRCRRTARFGGSRSSVVGRSEVGQRRAWSNFSRVGGARHMTFRGLNVVGRGNGR